jgi:hypothetical protein
MAHHSKPVIRMDFRTDNSTLGELSNAASSQRACYNQKGIR